MISVNEAEGGRVIHYVRMVRVRDGEQSSDSEVQFRVAAHVAPTGNIPPLPVDSHEADISPIFARPPGEGYEAVQSATHSPTLVGRTGYDGATIEIWSVLASRS